METKDFTDEQLIKAFSQQFDVERDTAWEVLHSEDPDLGRPYIVNALEVREKQRVGQERLTKHRRNLRSLT